MNVLSDSNLFLRLAEVSHLMHIAAVSALVKLRARGNTICAVPQNFYEF